MTYRPIDRRRKGEAGLSLVELLVVLGIIATISGVAIPVLARSGLFTSNKSQLAARELFTVLRAAKIYATTHNVETAVAYGGLIVLDSFTDENVPVVDSVAVVRRLKRDELLLHSLGTNQVLFVPLRARDGGFKTLPNGTCILPDIFEFGPAQFSGNESLRGLSEVFLWDIDQAVLLEPRFDYDLNGDSEVAENIFPAHIFSAEGGLIAPEGRQRLKFRVGVLPDAEFGDRFFQEPEPDVGEVVQIFFNVEKEFRIPTDEPTDPEALTTPLDIDVDIFLYVPTGRVKVGS